jgi:hypothetical protein
VGRSFGAICDECGARFTVNDGGGFAFHLLHCDKCGKEKHLPFEDIYEAHCRYLKGLPGPYCIATMDHDKEVQEQHPGPPLSEEEYHAEVERVAGGCHCGGRFTFDAPARCPKCRSSSCRRNPDGEGEVMYD